ncbi:hypothetical protein [Pseudomonas putida]|uniref:hypothetical protein n=1 Tax=Pseudomonas putida TaxID=303 RepID=UPI0021641FB9|nr:hypothetical protein [Pseudomonas putida]
MQFLNRSLVTNEKKRLRDHSIATRFLYNGKHCLVYEFTDDRAKICNLNQITIKDFEQLIPTLILAKQLLEPYAQESITKFENSNDTQIIIASLINSSIVNYNKITTSSNLRKKKENLYLDHIKDHLTSDELKTHKEIKSMRDKWIAHLDENHFDTAKTILIFDPDNRTTPAVLHHTSTQAILIQDQFLDRFIALSKRILEILRTKQAKDSSAFGLEEMLSNYTKYLAQAKPWLIYHQQTSNRE